MIYNLSFEKKKSLLAFIVCVITLTVAFSQNNFFLKVDEFDETVQREFVIIDATHPYDLNPQTASYASESQVLTSLYEGLFTYNPLTLDPEPALAESFKISRNKLTWTFTIRQGAKFSNGNPITAQTVKDSWISLFNPELKAPFASLLDCIVGVEDYRTGKAKDSSKIGITVKNENTLVVKLNAPTEHLSKILCHHAFSVISDKKNVYSGAFILESFSETEIVLKKNDVYWDATAVALPSVRFILSDDAENNTYLFNTGKVDWVAGDIQTQYVYDSSSIIFSSQFGTEYLFFKTFNNSALKDPNVRNALILAIPENALNSTSIIKTNSLVLQLRGYPEVFGLPDPDEELAIQLLEEAGYNETNKLKIKICFSNDQTSMKRAAILCDAWNKIGVEAEVQFFSPTEYISAIKTSNADLFCYIWIGDFADPLAFLELFRGKSSLNETGWANEKYDKLLEEAAKIADITERYEKLAEAEQLLIDDGVIIPMAHTVSLNVIDSQIIAGWYDNALDIHPLKYIRFVKPALPSNVAKGTK